MAACVPRRCTYNTCLSRIVWLPISLSPCLFILFAIRPFGRDLVCVHSIFLDRERERGRSYYLVSRLDFIRNEAFNENPLVRVTSLPILYNIFMSFVSACFACSALTSGIVRRSFSLNCLRLYSQILVKESDVKNIRLLRLRYFEGIDYYNSLNNTY